MIPPHLDVDNLMGLMPESVLTEYKHYGAAHTFGFSPGVRHWLENSQHPRLTRWRNDMRAHARWQWDTAMLEQEKMADAAREAYAGVKNSVRVRAVIHPVIKSWMETEHGPRVWKDRKSIADTERHHPRLFVNK